MQYPQNCFKLVNHQKFLFIFRKYTTEGGTQSEWGSKLLLELILALLLRHRVQFMCLYSISRFYYMLNKLIMFSEYIKHYCGLKSKINWNINLENISPSNYCFVSPISNRQPVTLVSVLTILCFPPKMFIYMHVCSDFLLLWKW